MPRKVGRKRFYSDSKRKRQLRGRKRQSRHDKKKG
jgi:hypothetical protein